MRENVQLKVYGHVWPAHTCLLACLEKLSGQVIGRANDDVLLFELDGDLIRISFEGNWFPVEDVLDVLRTHLTPQSRGKLDILDLDAWMLTRHVFTGEVVHTSSAPLNHVLAYSGH